MKKLVLTAFLLITGSVPAFASPITADNIVGRYNVEASYMFQKAYLKFRVLNSQEFEIQRYYKDGHADPTCQGTFVVTNSFYYDHTGTLSSGGRYFKGVFTCPDDRSKKIDFNIDYKGTQVEELPRGVNVTATTSMVPGAKLKAYVIKLP
ncbi:hypothetical protein [Bdellovibrio sp. KM01]|uniref:hypothetical protein n=1 Tax=Bdellovibrio sp. KM01 TaxID=2748865 RepID=UPI0015E9CD52|nr:hypothetical protein [Bdellovibrio sp. KM01]QLY25327.1 hypothetical protein HW988_18240 [Bdellovibrio sp. KM01]